MKADAEMATIVGVPTTILMLMPPTAIPMGETPPLMGSYEGLEGNVERALMMGVLGGDGQCGVGGNGVRSPARLAKCHGSYQGGWHFLICK